MKKILVSIFIIGIAIGVTRLLPQTQAAGTTSNSNQPGEVRIVDEDGVIYLTTETNQDSAGGTVYVVENATVTGVRTRPFAISIPESYAQNFGQLISFTLRLVLAVAALLVFAFLIMGAFDWITSGGDKGKVERARGKIVAAVIGLLIVSSSYAVMNLVLGFLGFGSIRDALVNVGTIERGPQPTPETDLGTVILSTPSATPN